MKNKMNSDAGSVPDPKIHETVNTF